MLPKRILNKEKEAEAGPSAEARIEARRKRIAARVQAKKRQVVGDDVQKKEEARPCQRQVEQSERRMTKLKADGTELVTNILVAADARELKRREELREANRLRLEKLENEVKSSTEKFNKIMNKWTEAKTTKIHQTLRDNLRQQQQLCWQVIEDKNKLINELQQELQARNAYFAKDRKREAEEVDLLIERMQKQTSSLKKDYRKELDLIECLFSDEWTDLLTTSKKEWEQQRKERSDKELEVLLQRMKMLEEHESLLDHLRIQSAEEYKKLKIKLMSDVQHLEQDLQERKASYQFEQKKHEYNKQMLKKHEEEYIITKAQQMRKITRHFALVDAKRYEEIWLMKEDEAKALARRAVGLDRDIYEQVLGLTWSPPTLPFMDHSSPKQPQRTAQHVLGEEDEAQCQTEREMESGSLESSMTGVDHETVKRVLELLCDETDFLVDSELHEILTSMDKNEQTALRLECIFSAMGIDNKEDINKMTKFLLKYKRPQTNKNVSVNNQAENESSLIHPNDILRALRAFTTREIPRDKGSALNEMTDSEVKAYWENIANIIPESKLKVWRDLKAGLKKYHTELTEKSKLLTETQQLEQQNSELRMLLHKYQNSEVKAKQMNPHMQLHKQRNK
ncbi:hypothetical protein QTP70_025986 [Hemibagrus guttatus]|uniref:Dynein regulatory complex protein 1 n=1 Tax=Hemibagrus guttatus TaxID=175788 RepID=A0AAE0V618_9TELE|nr:hypothetical protein QTP70_025986 [Hemibagrus guttatus]